MCGICFVPKQEKEVNIVYVNIYQDQMQKAYLFGTAVLYSPRPIPREDIPQ